MANDIWRASDPDAPVAQGNTWHDRSVPALFQFWWGGFVVLNFAYNVALRLTLRADDIPEYSDAAVAYLVADSLSVITGVLAILVVRRTTERQEARAAIIGAAAREGPDREDPGPTSPS
jgi:hypothetical protein